MHHDDACVAPGIELNTRTVWRIPQPVSMQELLDEIDQFGLATLFARHRAEHDRGVLLGDWIGTPTWDESRAFLAEHRDALLDPEVIGLLDTGGSRDARQHLAVLHLISVLSDEDVYALITDPTRAEAAALDAIETGDLGMLSAIFNASPGLANRPLTSSLMIAVLLLGQEEVEQARTLVKAVHDEATPMQRRAHLIRLRGLRAHKPDLGGVDDVIAILDADPET